MPYSSSCLIVRNAPRGKCDVACYLSCDYIACLVYVLPRQMQFVLLKQWEFDRKYFLVLSIKQVLADEIPVALNHPVNDYLM